MNAPNALKEAIERNDLTAVAAELATLSGEVDDYIVYSMPLVVWAAAVGRPDAVQLLIDAGSTPSKFPNALHKVIFSGTHMASWDEAKDVSALKLLIDAGCDPNGVDDSGDSPLHAAGMAAVHPERAANAARLLIDEGADLDRPENAGLLHRTVCTPATGMVEALLDGGADPNEVNSGGITPALSAAMELSRAFGRTRNNPDDDSAEVAAEFVAENLRLLIEHGADVSIRTEDGVHPLQIVFATEGSPESIKLQLLDAGAPGHGTIGVNGEDVDFLAITLLEGNSGELACRLYEAGCPLDAEYEVFGGGSYIRLAPQYGPEQMLALCKAYDEVLEALVNFRNEHGRNQLGSALAGKNRELVKMMLDAGASPDEKSEGGESVREYFAGLDDGAEYIDLLEELEQG